VTGKKAGSRQQAAGSKALKKFPLKLTVWKRETRPEAVSGAGLELPAARCPLPAGFTLLELLIVMSIIIILATITLPQYQRMVLHAKESVLREDLYQMRKSLDQYAADKGKLPQSLNDLVEGGYLREVPLDPITDQADWRETTGEDPNDKDGGSGIVDVHSSSSETGTDGKAYSEW
jgi:general secretion pathway protein G